MDALEEKNKNRAKFVRTGGGRRQDHGTRNLTHRRDDSDVSEWLVWGNIRRAVRHGADEPLEILEEEEVSPQDQ